MPLDSRESHQVRAAASSKSQRRVPLWLFIRRLAPFVYRDLIAFDEAVSSVMEAAFERQRCDSFSRAYALEAWIQRVLDREVEAIECQQIEQQIAARSIAIRRDAASRRVA